MRDMTPERLKQIVTFHEASPSWSRRNFNVATQMLGELIDHSKQLTERLMLFMPVEEERNRWAGDKINRETAQATRLLLERELIALDGRER